MKKLVALISIILVLTLSGCSVMSFQGSDIMCPPNATGNKAEIQELIDSQTSGEYTLKYPKSGNNRSSIIINDYDKDDEEEAIALYSDDDGDHIHLLFVDYANEEYTVIDDILLTASHIDRIDFSDIDGDKVNEILVGYTTSTSSQNTLNIFKYNKKITQLNISHQYSSLVIGDFTSDKNDDVLLISLYSGDIAAKAQLMIHNNSELVELSSVELDSDIKQLASATYSQIAYGTYGAVLDGVSSTGDYTTQVVFFDPASPALINPLFSYSGYNSTRRSTQICSYDYDNNELIDIPLCSLMQHTENEDLSAVSRQINWCNLDTETYALNTSKSSIFCPNDGYMLTMPEKWNNAVTARYNSKDRTTTIYMIEYIDDAITITDALVSIKAYSEDSFDKNNSGYTEFLRSGATVYAYSIGTNDSYLSVSGKEISSIFKLVNQ
ncbi:MAG: hypothetical protein Q4A12_00920 [Eubacteriales bacterium]|nr:hypothetical protein [Eubacteriales bacterium]